MQPRRGQAGWWRTKVRQLGSHLVARVAPQELAQTAGWLTPAQRALFDHMHVADQRHGLDVVASLRAEGVEDRDVLLAGLLHDCGKGNAGVVSRIAFALGHAYGPWVPKLASILPGVRPTLDRLSTHAETSAALAREAGCSERTAELIRDQDRPSDPEFGALLKMADEAN